MLANGGSASLPLAVPPTVCPPASSLLSHKCPDDQPFIDDDTGLNAIQCAISQQLLYLLSLSRICRNSVRVPEALGLKQVLCDAPSKRASIVTAGSCRSLTAGGAMLCLPPDEKPLLGSLSAQHQRHGLPQNP